QDERTAGGSGPGVNQRNLDDVGPVVQPGDEAPRLVVDESNAGLAIEVSGEVAEAAIDQIQNAVVDFNPGHAFLIERQRREYIPSTTGSHDDHARCRAQVVRDVRDVVLQVGDVVRIAMKCRQLGNGVRSGA